MLIGYDTTESFTPRSGEMNRLNKYIIEHCCAPFWLSLVKYTAVAIAATTITKITTIRARTMRRVRPWGLSFVAMNFMLETVDDEETEEPLSGPPPLLPSSCKIQHENCLKKSFKSFSKIFIWPYIEDVVSNHTWKCISHSVISSTSWTNFKSDNN